MIRSFVRVAAPLALAAFPLAAQDAAPAAGPAPAAPPAAAPARRVSWYSDRLPLKVGDLITIVVDEQTAASERVTKNATADRSQAARLNVGIDSTLRIGPSKQFGAGMQSSSREVGEAGRRGDLTAVLTVRIEEVDAAGNFRVAGQKTVTVDGRNQLVSLEGVVRPLDVTTDNLVSSSRIADAVVTYNGKKIGPKTGILGKILSILWP